MSVGSPSANPAGSRWWSGNFMAPSLPQRSWSTCSLACVKLLTNMGRRATGSTTRCGRFQITTTRTPGGGRSRSGGVVIWTSTREITAESVRLDVVHCGLPLTLGQTVSADSSTLCGIDCQVGGNFLRKTLILQKFSTRRDCAATSTHSGRWSLSAVQLVAYCGTT